jgi:RNA polymerase sigma factor (sigma-70 family)
VSPQSTDEQSIDNHLSNLDPGARDAELLARFVRQRDEAAFAALVARHEAMVYRVCRQLLRNPADAEDAFQAVFLVLVRRCGQVRDGARLAGWLYGVAHRVAAHIRAETARRRAREEQGSAMEPVQEAVPETQHELQRLLNEEVDRLPPRYRGLVVSCYLEGKSNEEAAREFCCPVGTVKGRLARARELLRRRLSRRGYPLSDGLLAATLSDRETAEAVPETLRLRTVAEALRFVGGASTSRPATLATAVLRGQWWSLARSVAAVVILSLLVLAPLASLLFPSTQSRNDPSASRLRARAEAAEQLRGSWIQTARHANGREEQIMGGRFASRWVFEGEQLTFRQPQGDLHSTYTVDPEHRPAAMDIYFGANRRVWEMVYEVDGDDLRICMAMDAERRRPTAISGELGGSTVVFIFRRERGAGGEK